MMMKKWTSAGGVVLDTLEKPYKVYVVLPSNNYGPWCLPKGRQDPGESLQQAALREVQEESGVTAKILDDSYLGVHPGSMSNSHYWVMVRTGPVGPHDHETERVELVDIDEAVKLFSSVGNQRDAGIVAAAIAYLENMEDNQLDESKQPLNELHVNTLGKIFFATLGAWLVGKVVHTKIRGSEQEVRVVANALLASKRFHEELRKPGASVEGVMKKLNVKHMSAGEFERTFGIPWPL